MLNESFLYRNGKSKIFVTKKRKNAMESFADILFFSECQLILRRNFQLLLPEKHPPEKFDNNFTNDKSQHYVQTINNNLILYTFF